MTLYLPIRPVPTAPPLAPAEHGWSGDVCWCGDRHAEPPFDGMGEHRRTPCAGVRLPTGVIRGWRRRGRHAGPGWLRDRIAALTWSDLAFIAIALACALASPMVLGSFQDKAAADIPTGPPRVFAPADYNPASVLAAGAAWIPVIETAPCSRSLPEWRRVRNVRITQVHIDRAGEATVHYAAESFRTIVGPIRVRTTTWHLWHVLRYEAGAWRHDPLNGAAPVTAAQATAGCMNGKGY